MTFDKSMLPCPICGAKAFVMHDIVDGFDFGWSAGCPRYKLDDGIHGISDDTPDLERPKLSYLFSKAEAIEKWNKKAERIKANASMHIL